MAIVLGCLGLAVTAGADSGPNVPRSEVVAAHATGAISIANPLEGKAILSARSLRPGGSATGTVTIQNTGSTAGDLSLSKSKLSDVPGASGGVLSSRLQLQVDDVTTQPPARIYAGTLAAMGQLRLPGPIPVGARRSYRFTVLFRDGGTPSSPTTGDNAYRSASASVQFDWSANPHEGSAPSPPRSPSKPRADVTAPVVTFGRASLRRRKLKVTITSNEASRISVRAKLYGTRALRRIKLKRVSKLVPAARPTKLSIKLPKRATRAMRKALRARKRVTVRVALTAKDKTGNTRRTSRRFRYRR